jgi:hypothetical protein
MSQPAPSAAARASDAGSGASATGSIDSTTALGVKRKASGYGNVAIAATNCVSAAQRGRTGTPS